MEILNYFSILKRKWWLIVICALILGGLSFGWAKKTGRNTYNGVVFVTVASQETGEEDQRCQNYYAVEAAQKFAETMQNWTKDPGLTEAVIQKAGGGSMSGLGAKKELWQNVVFSFRTLDEQKVDKLAAALLGTLQERISSYNTQGGGHFVLTNTSVRSAASIFSADNIGVFGFLIGLLLGIVLACLAEYSQGVVSSTDQAEKILRTKALAKLNPRALKRDTKLIHYLNAVADSLLLAGVDYNIGGFAVRTSLFLNQLGKKVILIDGDFKRRSLHHFFGVSKKIPSFNGFTDLKKASAKQSDLEKLLFATGQKDLKFVPTGRGFAVPENLFARLAKLADKIILATDLPLSMEIIKAACEYRLVLFVVLGQSKTADLEKIGRICQKEVDLVILG